MNIPQELAKEFEILPVYSENIVNLIDDGCTIPFIARYRKELTGSATDEMLRDFYDRLMYLRRLEEEKAKVIKNIDEQGKLTPELEKEILNAKTLAEVDDLYRPYKKKRKTRATIAIENGLEGLANFIQKQDDSKVKEEAEKYINDKVKTVDDAIQGALDIIAERVSDVAKTRGFLKEHISNFGEIATSFTKNAKENSEYELYKEFKEPVSRIPSHRILAINRGEKEKELRVVININDLDGLAIFYKHNIKANSKTDAYMKAAIDDSYKRLIYPSVENEIRNVLTEKAQEQAIKLFELNLKPLLMQAPLKNKIVLAVDPGVRTGCKIAVVDQNGDYLDDAVIFLFHEKEAEEKIKDLVDKHKVEIIAIGNGTATGETEMLISKILKNIGSDIKYAIVNEAGASVYSASELATKELPNHDVTVRGAISLARRLQDPLAELIKIDVKSIGVGQYQHDMPEKRLTQVLDGVVEDCVNAVGVDISTASASLLTRVSGLNKGIAENIIDYRSKNQIQSKNDLLKIKGFGPKAFEQSAGFIRVPESDNVFDRTGIHPESYDAANKLIEYLKYTQSEIENKKFDDIEERLEEIDKEELKKFTGKGILTLKDIAQELKKPGRDVREDLAEPVLRSSALDIKDLEVDMELDGVVRNVVDFGAFVDIGVHQDGLVHISQIAKFRVVHPSDVLKVGDRVKVKVTEIDLGRNRISLSMKECKNELEIPESYKEEIEHQKTRRNNNQQGKVYVKNFNNKRDSKNNKNKFNKKDNDKGKNRNKKSNSNETLEEALQKLLNKYGRHN